MIREVVEGTPAAKIGLQKGDRLISINGKEVDSFSALSKTIKGYLPNEKVKVIYEREDEVKEAMVELSDFNNQEKVNRSWTERPSRRSHGHPGKRHHNRHGNIDPNSPVLGVQVSQREDEIFVDKVVEGGSAEKAGVQVGDQIISINKIEMRSTDQFQHAVKGNVAGDEIKIKVKRDGKKKNVKATLQSMKDVMGQRYPNNTSQRIERIVIKDRKGAEAASADEQGELEVNDFELSPNPSSGNVNVVFSMDNLRNGEPIITRIISLDGKTVRENKTTNFDGRYARAYDLADLGAGVYLFQIEKNKQKFTKRFIVEKD